ncbi:MAG: ferritin [Spirochaetes bacterium]|nr:ferritin [Spirochaetota bacterium]
MINKDVAAMLNDQITNEFHAGYLYLSMAAQAEDMNLPGLANWFYVQHQEEHTHAMNIFKYLTEQGVKISLKEIKAPKVTWESPVEMAKDGLKHEELVTATFHKIMDAAHAARDYASIAFMNWYINEQVEEEAAAKDLIRKFEMAENRSALLFIDAELAQRVFAPALPVKATPVQLA